jgi:hypothetical protein
MPIATDSNNASYIATAIIAVLIIALVVTYSFIDYTPPNPYFLYAPSNQSNATIPNFPSCNGFNLTVSEMGMMRSGSCVWLGGLMNVTIYGGIFRNATLLFSQINSTEPFMANYSGTQCLSNSSAKYIPLGNYNITLSAGSQAVVQIGNDCGNATIRLSKT